MRSYHLLGITLVITAVASNVSAQDVEMLGRRYGTRPPAAYFAEMARDPGAFQFRRGRAERLRSVQALRGPAGAMGGAGPALALGPRSGPVTGTVTIPLMLALYSDTPAPPFTQASVQSAYFGPQAGTVSDYYGEVSSDSITLIGDVLDWAASPTRTEAAVAGGASGLASGLVAGLIKELLPLQTGVDWGLYDSDGPDGVPNSGDDDGFVDALAVMHPSRGAECNGASDRVWSHKWSLSESSGSAYTTGSPRSGGGFIVVDDYFIQGAQACTGSALNPIGVFVHETGHAFGLPDLYDTRDNEGGGGFWDLMASGNWGCSGNTPHRPCHMGAWSKEQLGWVKVTTLAPDADLGTLTLPPVETTGEVFRIDAGDGSGEYFLLENRQRVPMSGGYDEFLWREGLLVWQIADPATLLPRWAANNVNAHDRMGVWLRQADGLDDLGTPGGGYGDPGDPFPGSTANTAFHAGSNPASVAFQGTATGLTVLDIVDLNPANGGDLQFRVLTRFSTLTVSASTGSGGLFTVDGGPLPSPPSNTIVSAPFVTHTIEAAPGEIVQPGERMPFIQWNDAPVEPRSRTVVTPLADVGYVAAYGGTQYELQVPLSGGVNGVAPGTLGTAPASPDLWFAPSTDVVITATPQTGFNFLDWTGGLAGEPNPASVTMDAPVFAGADFQLIYAAPDVQLDLVATEAQSIQLATQNGTDPVAWAVLSGALPQGLVLSAAGGITGSSLDLGAFPLTVEATDAIGLTATATVSIDVLAPTIPITQLASVFLLGGAALSTDQERFLDLQGNADGIYDLGDFRAWVLANPSLPLSANVVTAAPPMTITLPVPLREPEVSR